MTDSRDTSRAADSLAANQVPQDGDERFRAIFEYAAVGIALVDLDGHVLQTNPELQRMLGYTAEEMSRMHFDSITHPEDVRRGAALFAELAAGLRTSCQIEKRYFRKDRSLLWGRLTASLVRSPAGAPRFAIGILEDVTDQKRMEDRLQQLSTVDELTGLYNRRGFLMLAEQQWRIARRKNRILQLLFIDLDNLKRINDSHGHQEGDRMLVDTAQLLRPRFRDTDVVARLGGDEFVILAIEAEETSTDALISRIHTAVEEFNRLDDRPYRLSLSVGAARYPADASESIDELLATADRLMYEQKRSKLDRRAGILHDRAEGSEGGGSQL